ncbi:MAG TPA: hypothetical protein IAB44_08025 [Candidatus Limivivens intestinipullorum]|uniref:Flagellar assembly protein H n=1 Tax=Candidatus Limivivens intestinipullorum TaxID=2840858 RepID=A0A9D1JK79_9FIRM|nr:hypothetical protein [Candidatus Limivivens intestinipullorum]
MLRLSDAYQIKEEEPEADLSVLVLNINPGKNQRLLETCQMLSDYSEYADRVRTYAKVMDLRSAVERAVKECIEEGILKDFLRKNRAEAIEMSIFEYDEEMHMRQVREEGLEEGLTLGWKEAEERINKLYDKLLEQNRGEDLKRAVKDTAYRRELFKEFGL